MTSFSTNIRTAALRLRTLWRPGLCLGIRRMVRSISASMALMLVPYSSTIRRNCSQNSASRVIEVRCPLTRTNLIWGDRNRLMDHTTIRTWLPADHCLQTPKWLSMAASRFWSMAETQSRRYRLRSSRIWRTIGVSSARKSFRSCARSIKTFLLQRTRCPFLGDPMGSW